MPSHTIRDHKQTKGFPRGSNGALGSEYKIFVGLASPLFAGVEPDSCGELDGEIGGENRWMLAGKRRGHQLQGVGKQKLCVLRLVIDQGQLQIVQVCPTRARSTG